MALLFMESYDGYGGTAAHMTKWASTGTLITSTPTPRTGSYCQRAVSGAARNIAPGSATVILGFAYYWPGGGAGSVLIGLGAGGASAQVTLNIKSDGFIDIRNGSTVGTLLELSGSAVMVGSSWNFIELKVLIANSGTWSVKVNGGQVLSGSGDTQNGASATIASVEWTVPTPAAIDDVYVLDSTGSYNNDFIGDCKVECLTPQTGNGTNTGLTLSTGSDHGAVVDEFPATDDTDYAYSASAGVKDTYNFPSVATTGVIKAVQVALRAKKTDSATKELAVVARENSTDSDGATQNVASTTYGQYTQVWERRPSDNAAWTISDVNAAEFGMKVVS